MAQLRSLILVCTLILSLLVVPGVNGQEKQLPIEILLLGETLWKREYSIKNFSNQSLMVMASARGHNRSEIEFCFFTQGDKFCEKETWRTLLSGIGIDNFLSVQAPKGDGIEISFSFRNGISDPPIPIPVQERKKR